MASVGVENLAQILAGIRNNMQTDTIELTVKGLDTDTVNLVLTKYTEVSAGVYEKQEIPLTEVYHNELPILHSPVVYTGYTHRYSIVLPEEYLDYVPYIQFRNLNPAADSAAPLKENLIVCPYCDISTTSIKNQNDEIVTKCALNYYTTKELLSYLDPYPSLQPNEAATAVYKIKKVILTK